MVNWLWRRVGEVLLPQPHVDLIFTVVLQQHLRCGVSGWKGGGAGNQPAATVFFLLYGSCRERITIRLDAKNNFVPVWC